ncbi:hypothetical protein HPB49_021978 [Dermacentor silvarum]|uniref:Uncharacterized protein n=1 Tax=Dermacentor silvarum TaxID=543639 RepID=A0ACB8C5R0_DERSI|nr:hypothetical protein HPB49_021978 [Dermacentor silvarum]
MDCESSTPDLQSKDFTIEPRLILCCDDCGECFSSPDYLGRHQRNRHKERVPGKHQCAYCSYSSNDRHRVTSHERTHTGERPFVCKICKRGFAQLCTLAAHMDTHNDQRPHACGLCDKRYRSSSSLAAHRRLHTRDAKPYVCPECLKGFNQRCVLLRHLGTHSGLKPHVCDVCGQRFTQSGSANRHRRSAHSKQAPVPAKE